MRQPPARRRPPLALDQGEKSSVCILGSSSARYDMANPRGRIGQGWKPVGHRRGARAALPVLHLQEGAQGPPRCVW